MTQRERSLVALLILVALIIAVWLVLIGPIVSGFYDRAVQRELLMQQYQINQRNIGAIPRLRRLAERQKRVMSTLVLVAATQENAVGVLVERVQRTIGATGGEIRSIEDSNSTNQKAHVRVDAQLTLAQLADALLKMQNEQPYLIVESLEVSSDDALVSGKLNTMEVNFEVSLPLVITKSR